MLQNAEFDTRPVPYILDLDGDGNAIVTLTDNVQEVPETDDKPAHFTADVYFLTLIYTETLEARLSASIDIFLSTAKARDKAALAAQIRARRDALLTDVDKHGSIFRLGLEAPEGSTFTAWLSFLRQLGAYLSGEWAMYRQALLDVPQQPGFPYDIVWPTKPADD